MRQVSDSAVRPLIDLYVRDKLVLDEGVTEQEVIDDYFESDHVNFMVDKGFLCIATYGTYAVVHFAWYDGRYTSRKNMVKLGKYVHNLYEKRGLPLYYQAKKNYYANHSTEAYPNVYRFVV